MHGLRGDVDHVGAGVAQADQQEQQPLFVIGDTGQLAELALVQGERGDDHRRAVAVVGGGQRIPYLGETGLEGAEGVQLLFERQVAGERRLGNHAGRAQKGITAECSGLYTSGSSRSSNPGSAPSDSPLSRTSR